jgi:hypothetical protein
MASIPLRRMTFNSTRAGPVGRFSPRSSFDTWRQVKLAGQAWLKFRALAQAPDFGAGYGRDRFVGARLSSRIGAPPRPKRRRAAFPSAVSVISRAKRSANACFVSFVISAPPKFALFDSFLIVAASAASHAAAVRRTMNCWRSRTETPQNRPHETRS